MPLETVILTHLYPFCFTTLLGVCLEEKESMQHNGPGGTGFRAFFPESQYGYDPTSPITLGPEYSSEIGGRKDVVTALPGQVVKIRAVFELMGKYTWHCHVLSHEDNEMMRYFEVVQPGGGGYEY
jgi:FtsP/CotA-like multicopper oxidase with cupredoxin domain